MPTPPIALKAGDYEDDEPASSGSAAVALAPGDYEDDTPPPVNPYANWRERRDVGQQLTNLSRGPGSTDPYYDPTAGPPSLLPAPKQRPLSPAEEAFSQEENTGQYVRPAQPPPRTNIEANRQVLNPPAPVLVPSRLAGPATAAELGARVPMVPQHGIPFNLSQAEARRSLEAAAGHGTTQQQKEEGESLGIVGALGGPIGITPEMAAKQPEMAAQVAAMNAQRSAHPVESYLRQQDPMLASAPVGAYEAGAGLKDVAVAAAHGDKNAAARGGTRAIQGAMEAGTIPFGGAIAQAPIRMVTGYLEGLAMGEAAGYTAKKLNMSPDMQEFAHVAGFFMPMAYHTAAQTLGLQAELGQRTARVTDPLTGEMKEVPVRTAAVGGKGFGVGFGKAEGGGYYGAARVGPFSVRGQWGGGPAETGPVIQGQREAAPVAGQLPAESQDPTANLGRPAAPPDGATIQAQAQAQTVTEVATRAADTQRKAAQVAGMAPPPPPPPQPGEAGSGQPPLPAGMENGHLSQQTVSYAARAIQMLPPALRPQAIRQAVAKLADWMFKSKTVVGPDDKLVNVDSPKTAQTEAINIINDGVDREAEAGKAQAKAKEDAAKQAEKIRKEQEKDQETAAQEREDALKATTNGQQPSQVPDTPLTRIIKAALQAHPEPATEEKLNKLVGTFPVVPSDTRKALVQEELTRRGNLVEDQGQANLTGEAPAQGKSRDELHKWAQEMVAGNHPYMVVPPGSNYKPEIATDKQSAFTKTTVKHSPDPELNGDFYHPKTIKNSEIRAAAESSDPRAALAEIEAKWRKANPTELQAGDFEEEAPTETRPAATETKAPVTETTAPVTETKAPLEPETKPEPEAGKKPVIKEPAGNKITALPRDLAGSKPRYGYKDKNFELEFEDPRDLAAYSLSQKTPNKRHDDFLKYYQSQFPGEGQDFIDDHAEEVREYIKDIAKGADPKDGPIKVPSIAKDLERTKEEPLEKPEDEEAPEKREDEEEPEQVAAETPKPESPTLDDKERAMLEKIPPQWTNSEGLLEDMGETDTEFQQFSQAIGRLVSKGLVERKENREWGQDFRRTPAGTAALKPAPKPKPVTPQVAPIKGVTPLGAKPGAGDIKLTQDWGTEINGYSNDPMREVGSEVKDKFLGEARKYLNAVSTELIAAGFKPHVDKKGKDIKPVSINEGGPAVSGDVSLSLLGPDDKGIYVSIGANHVGGAPATKNGVNIMYRAVSEKDPLGWRSPNQWAPVNLSAWELAQRLMKHVGVEAGKPTEPAKQPAAKAAEEPEEPTAPTFKAGDQVTFKDFAGAEREGKIIEIKATHAMIRYAPDRPPMRVPLDKIQPAAKPEAEPEEKFSLNRAEYEDLVEHVFKPALDESNGGRILSYEELRDKYNAQNENLTAQSFGRHYAEGTGPAWREAHQKAAAAPPTAPPPVSVPSTDDFKLTSFPGYSDKTLWERERDKDPETDEDRNIDAFVHVLKLRGLDKIGTDVPLAKTATDAFGDIFKTSTGWDDAIAQARKELANVSITNDGDGQAMAVIAQYLLKGTELQDALWNIREQLHDTKALDSVLPKQLAERLNKEDNKGPEPTNEQPESRPARVPGEAENLPGVPESEGQGGNVRTEESPAGSGPTAGGGDIGAGSGRAGPERVERPGGREGGGTQPDRGGRIGPPPDVSPERVGADGRAVTEPEPEEPTKAVKTAAELRNQNNYRISDEYAAVIGTGGEITKIKGNLDALELLKKIQAEGRERATPEEQQILAKYVDFGGLVGMLEHPYDRQYGPHYERFQKLLSPEEIQEIKETLPNTHYTSMQMVDWIWKAVMKMGFRNGRIGEMGMGIGNFYGRLPQRLSDSSRLFGVERNPLTGAMAKLLYPDAQILISPLQRVEFPDNSLDLVTGNVPFQDNDITDDPRYAKLKLNLHNYFIVKSLDKVRPGGIVAVITSRYTLDSTTTKGQRAREEMAKRADLLAAIRLPDGAFKRTANTEVVADLLIFRKRAANDVLQEMPAWTKTGEITVPSVTRMVKSRFSGQMTERTLEAKNFFINQYFIDNPHNVLGAHSQEGSMYGANQYTVSTPADFTKHLDAAMENIPSKVFGKLNTKEVAPAAADISPQDMTRAPEDVKPGAFYLDADGNVKIKQNGVATDPPTSLRTRPILEHIKAAIGLRDQASATIDLQLNSEDDEALKIEREKLNELYDAYTKKYGSISSGKDLRNRFGEDPEYPRLLALENVDTEKKTVAKAAIFTKRILAPYNPLRELPSDPKSAMLKVLAARGYLDIGLMSDLLKEPRQDIIDRLEKSDLIYQDPQSGNYHTADEYLSGDVREKLRLAADAARVDPKYIRNAEALEKVQPKARTIHQIQPNLGMTWVPDNIYRGFVAHLMGINARDVTVARGLDGRWLVQTERKGSKQMWDGGGIAAYKLVQFAMNQQQPSVWINHSDGTRTLDTAKTAGAREKLQAIKEEFKTVLRNAPKEVVKSLEDIYNKSFNSIARREFDGEHLDFPGMTDQWRGMIRGYQKAFVWRVLQEGRAGLFHAPGLGKTLTMIAAGQEAIRLKLSRKNMYAVPNNMVPQWRDAFKAAYPNTNLLAVQDEDFTPENRNKLLSRIATGDWDAVLIAHSQFDTLAMSPVYEMETINAKIQELREVLGELDKKEDKRTIKQIEKLIDKLESRLNVLNARKKDKSITFDQMGFGMLFVDEAHAYKAMQVPTRMGNIKGINRRASQRAFGLEIKLNYMRKTHGGRGVVLGTGTPLTNTIGEVYVMTKYLAPELLEEAGIRNFDDWVAQFANPVTTWEYAPDGVTFKPSTSLSQFVNVRELQTQFQRFSEYLSTGDAVKLAGIKLPEAHRKDLKVIITPPQEPMLLRIAERGEALIKHPPRTPAEMKVDNWLKLGSDARAISLDPRLYDPRAEDHPGSKVNRTVALVKELLDKTKDNLGAVAIFSDFFQHYGSDGKIDFNLFEDIRKKLVAAGVPRKEIAVVADAGDNKLAKEAMFAGVRAGRIRVIMGSTEKMGIGVNIQDRLYALIHLDQPYRPDQVEQREARAIRSGNMYATPEWGGKAEIYRMISEPAEGKMKVWDPESETEIEKDRPRSHDLQMYQVLERKATSQEQFLSGKYDGDTLEDTAGDVKLNSQMFAMGKALATGNPDAIRRLKLDHDLRTQELLQRNFESETSQSRWELTRVQDMYRMFNAKIPELTKNLAIWKAATDKFEAEKEGQLATLKANLAAAEKEWAEIEPEATALRAKYNQAAWNSKDKTRTPEERKEDKAQAAAYKKQWDEDPRFQVYEKVTEAKAEIKALEDSGILPPVKFGDLPELTTREERIEFNKQHPDLMEFVGKDIVIGGIKTSLRVDTRAINRYTQEQGETRITYWLPGSEYDDWHEAPFNAEMKRYLPGAFLNSFASRARNMGGALNHAKAGSENYGNQMEALEAQGNRDSPYRDKIDAMRKEIEEIDKRLGKVDPNITAAPEDEGAVIEDEEGGGDELEEKPRRGGAGSTVSFLGTGALEEPAKAVAAYAGKAAKATWNEAIEAAKVTGKTAKVIGRELVGFLYPNALASTKALDIMGKATGEPAMRSFEAGQLMHGISKMFDAMTPEQWTDFIDRKESGVDQRTADLRHAQELIDSILEAQRERENEAVNLGRPPEVDIDRFKEVLADGASNKDLADQFGISWQQARAWRRNIAAGEEIKQDRIELTDKPGYFPHRWEKGPNDEEVPSEDEQIEALGKPMRTGTGRRPFEGSKAFMKQQTWGYRDAIEAGAEPIGSPVKQVMQRLQEGAKFVAARYAWHNLKGAGLALFLKRGRPLPVGYRYVDDKSANVWRMVQSTELTDEGVNRLYPVETGRWIVQGDAARLLNNYLSEDSIRGSETGRALIKLKNASTEIRLSWSAFHWGFITAETFSAALQVGMDKLYNRGFRDLDSAAAKEGLADIGRAMVAPHTAIKMGGNMIQYARNPQEFLASPEGKKFIERYPEAYRLMQLLHQGGMRWDLDNTFRGSFGDHAIEAWKAGELGKALGKTLPWLAQMVARPLFEHYIPRAKWTFAVQMLSSKLAQYSAALADGSKTEVEIAREIAEMSDNFFGEVNWDSLFLRNTMRTAMQLSFRSATWKMGSWRAAVQAGKEQFSSQAFDDHMVDNMKDQSRKWDWARQYTSRMPQMGANAGRLLATALFVGITGSILSKIFSKKWPWQWAKEAKNNHGVWANAALEAMHFRTGQVDAHGEPVRFSFPTGLKEYEHAPEDPWRYLKGAQSDWLSNAIDSLGNEDAYGNYIYDPNDPIYTKFGMGLLYNIKGDFTPMSVANWKRTYGSQDFLSKASRATGMIGGAPKSLDRSAALQEAISLEHHQAHTPAQQQEWEYARSAPPTRHDLLKAHREKDMDYLEKLVMKMSYTDAMKVYEKATPEEKKDLNRIIYKKRVNMIKAGRGR